MMRIGTIIYGFCRGEFGSDSYKKKRVEAIGSDWIVVREDDGHPNFAAVVPEELEEFTTEKARHEYEELTYG